VLGIFRVHGLALIRRFLLAERHVLTFPDFPGLSRSLPPCLPKFVARMQRITEPRGQLARWNGGRKPSTCASFDARIACAKRG
jgi:hypothetical protein